ncbi:hypothetical protein PN434_03885 [Microcystis aeruginosa CS-558/01A06]|uniref:Endonuclease/exonuclease/phosphatase domain-containing protein n=1 Tax=Microcystis aeruginosa BLCC-F108 TaxID=2755317 RepID=A0A841UMP2_MICAE|nr:MULTISPECIES: endonuclease/exonuclease/phosphatase family protein [Microcystis]MBC1189456.1 hypothetical protein [Microcystis aeruginosa BLCC-F108]MCA2593403.1 hypothetical protein [Microcystis sp. M31BS1]MDB9407684.1 hypothetical protein [Microcystis aeruginosa CS-558/01A06]
MTFDSFTVASWNIEKNGRSSRIEKRSKVDTFIYYCCNKRIDIIFLCEVHGARLDDYLNNLSLVYFDNYDIHSFEGGKSNGYIIMTRKRLNIELSMDKLSGLNRYIVLLSIGDFYLVLAHFKSGRLLLTERQIKASVDFLASTGYPWAVTGDMNWDYKNIIGLKLSGATETHTYWADQTHRSGGILDWCITGSNVQTVSIIDEMFVEFPDLKNMDGPDHRPIVFLFQPKPQLSRKRKLSSIY